MMRKWRENEEMEREWGNGERMRKLRENEEIERKWRENEEMEREWGNWKFCFVVDITFWLNFTKSFAYRSPSLALQRCAKSRIEDEWFCSNLKCTTLVHPMSRMTTSNLSKHLVLKSFLNALKLSWNSADISIPVVCILKFDTLLAPLAVLL